MAQSRESDTVEQVDAASRKAVKGGGDGIR